MATFRETTGTQSKQEIRKWTVDFSADLLTGVTVTAGTAIHTPPSGSASTPSISVSSPYVVATLGTLSATGVHYLDVRATCSNAEVLSVMIPITVGYPSTAARSGMLDLIEQVRQFSDASPTDYHIGGRWYWSDADIQTVLDKHRIDVYQEELEPWPALDVDNTYSYTEYRASRGNLESGTAVFIVQMLNGGTAPAYTADYATGIITFDEDTAGTAYMLTARAYDVNAAAADVWRSKAANVAKYFDFQTDNHKVNKASLRKSFLDMAAYFDMQSETKSFQVTTINRSDVNTYVDLD